MRTIMRTQSEITTPRTKTICQDEAAIVRVGRLANAIAFAKYIYKGNYNDASVCTRRRQVYHSMFLLGGYLFEAMRLANELSKRYGDKPFFSDLLVFKAATVRYHDIFNEFVFSPGFHLESTAKATGVALEKQQLDLNSILASVTLSETDETYYHAIFAFDTQCFVNAVEGSHSLDKLYEFSRDEMPEIAERFLAGASQFIGGLAQQVASKRTRQSRR